MSGQSFTKGKQYEFRFTRSGSDSINYYFSDDNPYGYGAIKGGGVQPDIRDLCLRVYGVMDADGMRAEGGGMKQNRGGRPSCLPETAA
jgi:hypothetical protein